MLRLSGPMPMKSRTGAVVPCAPGWKTNVVASDRNVCTYRCPEESNVTPHGSPNALGSSGASTVCTAATAPRPPARYTVTGPSRRWRRR
jgi:hypothetical protein